MASSTTLTILILIVVSIIFVSPIEKVYSVNSTLNYTYLFGLKVDVYTDRGGLGLGGAYPFGWSKPYGPKEEVYVHAKVTISSKPVKCKSVTFEMIDLHGESCGYRIAFTDADGIATACFETPWEDLNVEVLFGNWSITGTVGIAAQTVVTDIVYFRFSYIIDIRSITVSPDALTKGETMAINIEIQSISATSKYVFLTITACDELSVPIDSASMYITVNSEDSIMIDYTMAIPSWAFVGTGTIYVNVFTDAPTAGGTPYCPERTAKFIILNTP